MFPRPRGRRPETRVYICYYIICNLHFAAFLDVEHFDLFLSHFTCIASLTSCHCSTTDVYRTQLVHQESEDLKLVCIFVTLILLRFWMWNILTFFCLILRVYIALTMQLFHIHCSTTEYRTLFTTLVHHLPHSNYCLHNVMYCSYTYQCSQH